MTSLVEKVSAFIHARAIAQIDSANRTLSVIREERVMRRYCERETLEYDTLTDAEYAACLGIAEEEEQEMFRMNGWFGAGA